MTHPSASIEIRSCERAWLGSRHRVEIKRIATTEEPLETSEAEMEPKQAMWACIQRDYTLSNHLSHIACTPPDSNKPPPAIQAAIAHCNRLISSTIFHFAVAHCFDTDYSDRFWQGANDITACPCNLTHPLPPHGTPSCHTHHHVLFYCPLMVTAHAHHLQGFSSLTMIFRTEEASLCLAFKLRWVCVWGFQSVYRVSESSYIPQFGPDPSWFLTVMH